MHYHGDDDVDITLYDHRRGPIRFVRMRLVSFFIVCMFFFFFFLETIIIIVFTERSPTVRPRPATGIQVVASTYLGTYYNIIMYT